MSWTKLNRREQNQARRTTEQLWKLGVTSVTVSQVANKWDEAQHWDGDEATLPALCAATGWTAPAPATRETTVRELAAELGVSTSTIYRRIHAGKVTARRGDDGRRWIITIPA